MQLSLKIIFFASSFLFIINDFAQNSTEIVKDALIFAKKQESGKIVANHKLSLQPNNILNFRKIQYSFVKNKNSQIYPFHFAMNYIDSNSWLKQVFIDDVHHYFNSDSDTIKVRKYENLGKDLVTYIENMLNPLPYGQNKNYPFPTLEELDSNLVNCELLCIEKIATKNCYVIKIKSKINENPYFEYLTNEKTLWIEKNSKLLWRFETDLKYVLEGDTIQFFNETEFEEINLGKVIFDKEFQIPTNYAEKIIFPKPKTTLINIGEIAPEWQGENVDGEIVKLRDFKGKIIFLDFFFRGCTGCMQVMPDIISIYQKFKDRGLIVISIDPIDDILRFKDMKAWLEKKEMTQHVVFTDIQIANNYGVSAYPSYVLINEEGKVAWSLRGFEKDAEMKDVFEREILKILK
jgi:thiol-disulfide isomerase/thioredoxin